MEIKHCKPKIIYDCVYLTKENYNKFLDYVMGVVVKFEIEENGEKYIIIKNVYNNSITFFAYNNWYVKEYDYETKTFKWIGYNDIEFERKYDFVN